jgi:hypothetical protein
VTARTFVDFDNKALAELLLIRAMKDWLVLLFISPLSLAGGFHVTRLTRRQAPSSFRALFSTPRTPSADGRSPSDLLEATGYGKRILRIKKKEGESRIVEVFVNGHTELSRLVELVASTKNDPQSPPRAVVEGLTGGLRESVDLGQITTIWTDHDAATDLVKGDTAALIAEAAEVVDRYRSNPVALDKLLERLYARIVRKGRQRGVITRLPKNDERLASFAKKIQKTGPGYARLIDSSLLSDLISSDDPTISRLVASSLVSLDSQEGGRFKRWPSLLVDHDDESWTIVNGGWIVVDQSVRAGTDARKLVQRSAKGDNPATSPYSTSDARTIQRLECLAMGEDFDATEVKLEKDVLETLRTMNLSFSSDGARIALVRLGRWTASTRDQLQQVAQPWSPEILQAASWYAGLNWLDQKDETRVDLRQLPCVCVDAKSTSFRDDAMGVRPRSSTGRWLDEESSKWEILVHITDTSDVYAPASGSLPDTQGYLSTLMKAAEYRGISRYDLPLGPLHLLPPIVLEALSFSKVGPHRCLTLWVYIDERSGRLLDAGFERSIVSPPLQLSYSDASRLIEGKPSDLSKDSSRARSILLVAERNLNMWKERRVQESANARKREGRQASKAAGDYAALVDDVDDGSAGFRRSRSHRIVDSCLDIYSFAGARLLRRKQAPLPVARGADVSRGGRLATAPLRRYIDGQAQRQILAVLCSFGDPLSLEDCRKAGKVANNARNAIANVRAGR